MIRQVLLAHPSRAMRGLIKKFVFAEFSDIEMTEADCAATTLASITGQPFHVILVTDQPFGLSLEELKRQAGQSEHNTGTPIIVLTEAEAPNRADQENLRRHFRFIVPIRVRPCDLITQINTACNPRAYRRHDRYHLPNTEVILHNGAAAETGRLINISQGGILLELQTGSPTLLVSGGLCLDLRVSLPGNAHTVVTGLTCRLLSLKVSTWDENDRPRALRTTYVFKTLSAKSRTALNDLLRTAEQNHWDEPFSATAPRPDAPEVGTPLL